MADHRPDTNRLLADHHPARTWIGPTVGYSAILQIDLQGQITVAANVADGPISGIYILPVEYEDHPWFIGVQYHPELKSRPFEPHPLFSSFVGAAVEQSRLV